MFYGAHPRSLATGLRPLDAMRLHLVFRCAAHFANVGKWIFKHIGTVSADSQIAFTLLEIHEPNIWGVLRRGDELIALLGARPPVKDRIQWNVHGKRQVDGAKPRRGSDSVSDFRQPADVGGEGSRSTKPLSRNATVVAGARIAASHLVSLSVWLAQAMLVAGRIHDGIRAAEFVACLVVVLRCHSSRRVSSLVWCRCGLRVALAARDKPGEANVRKALGLLLYCNKKYDEAKAMLGGCAVRGSRYASSRMCDIAVQRARECTHAV